jgi:hypothetical protein
MALRATACLIFAAIGGCAAVPAAPAFTPMESAQRAHARGVEFLIGHQNDDGSWGRFESARPFEIYLGTVASHRGFRDACTALAVMALQEPSRTDDRAFAAMERGLTHLITVEPPGRATPDTFYDTWAHTFTLQAMARAHMDDRFADRRDELAAAIERSKAILVRRQSLDGGWAYYDFGHGFDPPSGAMSTSFNTASVVVALHEAELAGFPVDDRIVHDGLRCLERLRLPDGAYVYSTDARFRPGVDFNRPKGSLTRSQPCNLALWIHGRGVSVADLQRGLDDLREQHHFLEIAYARPRPHEAWYFNSGYYVLYGHAYASLVAWQVDAAARHVFHGWQAGKLIGWQNADGSWADFPFYGYHKAYGTGFALLALQECIATLEEREAIPARSESENTRSLRRMRLAHNRVSGTQTPYQGE